MLLDLYNQTFTTAQVAEMMNVSPQAVNKRSKLYGWKRTASTTQGGGFVWLFKSMDQETRERISRAAIRTYQAANPSDPEEERKLAEKWQEFDKKCGSIKERAFEKQRILMDALDLHHAGTPLTKAFEAVAQVHGVTVGSLRNWYYGCNGKQGVRHIADPKDWAPFLADDYKGRVARAKCDETAWEFLKKDYLRKESPSFLSAFRRLERAAAIYNWIIPSARTLSRRIVGEFTYAVIYFMRTGKLFNDYPDQVRRRDSFGPGEAVTGDALSFDRVHVFDELTGEVFNPRVWFFEDIHSGKILAWESDKTENSDMFRRAVYNLTADILPRYMCIDNTRAAANKCLTGQVPGRHRFTNKDTDPVGLLKLLKIDVHFTNPDHEVTTPGAKFIERAFGRGGIHSSMREHPALIGRATFKKPIPYSEFLKLLPEVVAEHNARRGRTGGLCNGRSFDEVYADGLRRGGSIRTASPELRRLLLCSQESCKVSPQSTVSLKAGKGENRHRYYSEALSKYANDYVAVLFNPKAMSEPVSLYTRDGNYIGEATWLPTVAFNDTRAAREHAKHKARHAKLIKKAATEAIRISDLEFNQLNAPVEQGRMPEASRITTVLSPVEIEKKCSGKSNISAEQRESFYNNLLKNLEKSSAM